MYTKNLSGMTQNYQGRAEGHRAKKPKADEGEPMKREDITQIFEGATKEQIDQLLNLNSADIGKAKGGADKLQADLDAANAALAKARETISGLEAAKGDMEGMKKQIEAYQAAEEQRKQEAKKREARAELEERFGAVSGDRKYIHDMVREGVMRDFDAALKDRANRGKSDSEIFEALTKDKGYFASQAPQVNPFSKPDGVSPLEVKDRAGFFKLSFAEQQKFKQQNETQFRQLFGLTTNND